jgi:hypothetical protein
MPMEGALLAISRGRYKPHFNYTLYRHAPEAPDTGHDIISIYLWPSLMPELRCRSLGMLSKGPRVVSTLIGQMTTANHLGILIDNMILQVLCS